MTAVTAVLRIIYEYSFLRLRPGLYRCKQNAVEIRLLTSRLQFMLRRRPFSETIHQCVPILLLYARVLEYDEYVTRLQRVLY